MKKLWFIVIIAIVLVSNSVAEQKPAYQEPEFNLDHFKAYKIENVKAKKPKEVTVKDQFIDKPATLKPELIKFIILPVSKKIDKKISPILNKQNHLAWNPLRKDTSEIKFAFSNQFTNFKFTEMVVKKLRAILVPTEKIEKGSQLPETLDHYLCYQRIKGERTTKTVTLGDQFQKEVSTKATGPEYFCVPCSKDGKEIKNKADHLAVYVLGRGKSAGKSISIQNQFGDQSFDVKDQIFLLVPSKKKYPLPEKK